MRKYLILLFILLIFSIPITYYYISISKESKYLSNITELYSSFTSETKDFANFYLSISNCKPTQYYFEDSILCFKCLDKAVCFKYIQDSVGQIKMPGLTFLKYDRTIDQKDANLIASFYTYSLTDFMSCKSELLNKTFLKSYCPNYLSVVIQLQDNSRIKSISYFLENATISNLGHLTESYYNFLIYSYSEKNISVPECENLDLECEEIVNTTIPIKLRCGKGWSSCYILRQNNQIECRGGRPC